jgi:hypothetical protein
VLEGTKIAQRSDTLGWKQPCVLLVVVDIRQRIEITLHYHNLLGFLLLLLLLLWQCTTTNCSN